MEQDQGEWVPEQVEDVVCAHRLCPMEVIPMEATPIEATLTVATPIKGTPVVTALELVVVDFPGVGEEAVPSVGEEGDGEGNYRFT